MKQLTIEWITKACNGKLIHRGGKTDITTISTDTRTINEGALFIPLMGENFDGHKFISQAIEKGAYGILKQREVEVELSSFMTNESPVTIIEVEDTLTALREIGRHYRQLFPIPFIGVTGSVGKTTTKDLISSVLGAKYNVLKNIGNLNNQIGLPMTLLNLADDHEVAVLEMGMSSFGEIQNLVDIVRPQVAVITNIGMSHIENLGSRQNILKAKMEIATYLQKGEFLLLNGDDEYLQTLTGEISPYQKVFFGLSPDNDIYPEGVKDLGEEGFTFDVKINGNIENFTLRYPGLHNVYNTLAAIWIGTHNGMTPAEIQKGLDEYTPTKMRMEIIDLANVRIINDAYNASPDSMKAALTVLDQLKGERKIAILGNILEMGEFAEEGHRIVGDAFAKLGVEILITVGDSARWIAQEAQENIKLGKEIYSVENNHQAIELLKKILKTKDVVLVKGSRGMKMEEIVNFLQERS